MCSFLQPACLPFLLCSIKNAITARGVGSLLHVVGFVHVLWPLNAYLGVPFTIIGAFKLRSEVIFECVSHVLLIFRMILQSQHLQTRYMNNQ